MRTCILALLIAAGAAPAAERESITLADGRTLVGVYDADAGTVTLDGHGTAAVVMVRADQVRAHEPAPAAVAKPAVETKAPPRSPSLAWLAECQAEVGAYQDERKAFDLRQYDLIRKWKAHILSLPPIPPPQVGADPRTSEVAQARHVAEINGWLQGFKSDAQTNMSNWAPLFDDQHFRNHLAEYDRMASAAAKP